MIEQNFDLAGATAIEDKLQKGVPETVDKLRRANIKIWMLTGDKRETAINIAHSARLAKSYSEVIILDHTTGEVEQRMATALLDIEKKHVAHSVIVVDGQTLSEIDANETLKLLFFDLAIVADSVICCRASPSQKASLVKKIRTKVKKSITLAIGDGANDIAMIQEAHVGIGISGKEGLQAARISDYSIAQFRFLQRLLFVHGKILFKKKNLGRLRTLLLTLCLNRTMELHPNREIHPLHFLERTHILPYSSTLPEMDRLHRHLTLRIHLPHSLQHALHLPRGYNPRHLRARPQRLNPPRSPGALHPRPTQPWLQHPQILRLDVPRSLRISHYLLHDVWSVRRGAIH
jgi:soluble P-type ATPase